MFWYILFAIVIAYIVMIPITARYLYIRKLQRMINRYHKDKDGNLINLEHLEETKYQARLWTDSEDAIYWPMVYAKIFIYRVSKLEKE